mmetsp:Transcript_41358/g.95534  ORF Transcript_41358/g.95534 Transcript_41358/m.95534 type:complete len:415 (-) Transcript_41358:201-1445(-)
MLIMLTPEHLETLETLTDADEESLKSLATACSTSDATNGRTKIDMINDILAAMLAPTGDWDTTATPAELRAIVDQRGLPISKQIGGRTKRTKQEMLAEVVTHLAQAAEANALQADAEAKALSLRLADMITTTAKPSAPFTPNRIRRQSSPTSSSKPDSPLSVAELELLLSPEERKIEEYRALCEKLGLDANKLCQTGTPAGWTKVDVASRILVSVAEREERAGSLRGEHKALCELVAKHGLPVNTITGLKDRRTNEDIAFDILRCITTPEYKAHRVQSYTTGPVTKTATTTTEPLDPVRANLTNLFDQAGNEEQKAEEDPGVVLDVHPPPAAAVVTAGNTVYRFVLGFVLCVLCMGLCLTCVVAGNDLWKTLARFSLDSVGTWRDVAGAILEGAFRSGIPGGPSIFLQGLQSIR